MGIEDAFGNTVAEWREHEDPAFYYVNRVWGTRTKQMRVFYRAKKTFTDRRTHREIFTIEFPRKHGDALWDTCVFITKGGMVLATVFYTPRTLCCLCGNDEK